MRRSCYVLTTALLSTLTVSPAFAQEAAEETPAITISGSAAVVSDYRFRGVSQSDDEPAVQAGITITHESGFYLATWGSNLAGWGTFGGPNLELDLVGGWKKTFEGGVGIDVGVTVYTYPGGADTTTVWEPYAKLSGTVGGASLLAGVAYAPSQKSMGKWYFNGTSASNGVYDDPGDKEDNLYIWGDVAYAISGTPFTAKAHIGHSWGNDGLGPNGTSLTPTGSYTDWSLGLDTTYKNLTLGIAYVDTSISSADAAYLQPGFSKGNDGTGSIASGKVVFSLTAAF